jgi:uncharacterized SAM-dependent methyltransferase
MRLGQSAFCTSDPVSVSLMFLRAGSQLISRFLGNFDRNEAAQFLKSFTDVLRPSDKMLIGVDACCDPAKV